MAKYELIQDEWKTFERIVVPKEANITQRAEMRMAFVAGITIALKKIRKSHVFDEAFQDWEKESDEETEAYTKEYAKEIYTRKEKEWKN